MNVETATAKVTAAKEKLVEAEQAHLAALQAVRKAEEEDLRELNAKLDKVHISLNIKRTIEV